MKDKHKYGQYFTKGVVAEFMVGLISHPSDCRVLEPSCGEGVFLRKLAARGYGYCKGYEIDSGLSVGMENVEHKSFLSVSTEEKYDVVIGNPPYIRWKNLENELKDELAGNELWNRYFNSLCDYLFVFILKSVEHLVEGGELVFICSDYWMNTTHADSLRNYMVQHGYFEKIYHFKEAALFEGVNASFVIFKYVKKSHGTCPDIELLTYTQKAMPTIEMLRSEQSFIRCNIPQFRSNERWLLATREMQDELRWFENACSGGGNLFGVEVCRIGDVCDIGNGMVSGLDAAFKLKEEEVRELTDEELQHTIHVLKAKDLNAFRYVNTSRYIYLPSGMDSHDFEDHFPHFKARLEPYKDALLRRYSYGRDLPYWEFAFPRSKSLFERDEDKIFIPCKERISHKSYFRFCYAPKGFFPLQDVTAIVRKPKCRESVEFLLAYLNSKYVYDWLRFNGIVKGEIVEFSETPVASIPYRRINWADKSEVSLHDSITRSVRSYLADGNDVQLQSVNSNLKRLLDGCYKLQEIA